jgi:AcrR family transcriptional regulator
MKCKVENMMGKSDFRVRITRKVLQDSLLILMKEKSILDISIKDICELSGLSRSTFYTYCKNQYDLLRQIEEQTFNEVDKMLHQHIMAINKSGSIEIAFFKEMLEFIVNNSNSIQVLLSENGDSGFQKKYFRTSIEGLKKITKSVGSIVQDKEVSMYGFVFVTGGVLTLVQEWLKNGMNTPVPQMAELLGRLTREVLR